MPKTVEIYQIKVTLRDSQPPVWRRIQVRSETTLGKLHEILQCVMGREDAHLHLFIIHRERYGTCGQDQGDPRKTRDERRHKLSELVSGRIGRFAYTYDFGDNWEHILEIEKSIPPEAGVSYPLCVDGARTCPSEDMGGIPGYKDFLKALNDPSHPELT